ncbi:MAG: exodeoxyribonuclease V subunit gamma, partial [Planctomycetales bacterium]|nr:exodeoxyribonuclease V subunit gamma [Planctomycetales bacterium]
MLHVAVEDWPFRRLLSLLTSNYFAPAWPEWLDGRAAADAERLIRHLQVPRGSEELLKELQRCGGRDDEFGAAAGRALQFLTRLRQCFERLPPHAAPSQWAATFDELADEFGMFANAEDDRLPAVDGDRRGWQRLQELLVRADQQRAWLGDDAHALDLAGAIELVEELLAIETLPASADATGCVRILSAEAARTLEIPVLFFAGLSERSFPAPARDSQLYSEAEMAALKSSEVPFVDRQERNCEEMLLFYEVLSRATRQLVLSYPALDEAAHPHSPSSYLLEVERAAGAGAIEVQKEIQLSPVPTDGQPLGPADLRTLAVAEACEGKADLLSAVLHDEGEHAACPTLAESLRANLARQRGDSFGTFEGVFASPQAAEALEARFGAQHPWSPSRLEGYAYCPFQFFSQHVLRLAPLDDLVLETDYLGRGGLLHDVLADVHREINEQCGRPASPVEVGESDFLQCFSTVLDKQLRARAAIGLEAALREIDRRTLLDWANGYYQQHEKYDRKFQDLPAPCKPAHFEVRFGPRRGAENAWEDPLSRDEPLELDLGRERIAIIGRIDRIDTSEIAGQRLFNLLDYKTGRSQSLKSAMVADGTALQLPLYALAARDLLSAEREAHPWLAAYWYVRDGGTKSRFQFGQLAADLIEPTAEWKAIEQQAVERVGKIVAGLRAGEFPMACRDLQCTSQCDFRTVCRVHQTRALEKQWPPPAPPDQDESTAEDDD